MWIKSINSVRIEHRALSIEEPSMSLLNEDNEYCRFDPAPLETEVQSPVDFRREISSPINCLSPTSSSSTTTRYFSRSFSSNNRESGIGLSTSNSDGNHLSNSFLTQFCLNEGPPIFMDASGANSQSLSTCFNFRHRPLESIFGPLLNIFIFVLLSIQTLFI